MLCGAHLNGNANLAAKYSPARQGSSYFAPLVLAFFSGERFVCALNKYGPDMYIIYIYVHKAKFCFIGHWTVLLNWLVAFIQNKLLYLTSPLVYLSYQKSILLQIIRVQLPNCNYCINRLKFY